MKKLFLTAALCAAALVQTDACTGISLTARDGGYVQARTIEWGGNYLPSEYVIIPRGQSLTSFTPTGQNGLKYEARYGVVGLSTVLKEFIVEGLNEAGLSAGLFYFPHYGEYEEYLPEENERTLSDMQVVSWMLSRFSTIDEVKKAMKGVTVVGLDKAASTVHWRIGEPSGRQVVLEIIDGEPRFYENKAGVITNAPDFPWQVKNLNNYVNLRAGSAPTQQWQDFTLAPFGAGSGMLGLPGDVTPPSRFVRIAFFRATAPQSPTARDAVMQAFHILNNFDIPIGTEHEADKVPDGLPSATQWTSAIDLTGRKLYYRTAWNSNLRSIDLQQIDFARVKYQSHPLDRQQVQPVEQIAIR